MSETHQALNTLRRYLAVGLVLLIAHKIESFLQGEYLIDQAYTAAANFLSTPANANIALIAFLAISFGTLWVGSGRGKPMLVLFAIAGILFTHEIHHLIRGLVMGVFYPGTIGGLVLFVFSFWYWKAFLNYKRS